MNRSMVTNHYPDGRIYNSDGICCFPGVINEMLVYSRPGEIELLPALPTQLKTGEAQGIQCRSKLRIENLKWDLSNKTITCEIYSYENQVISLKYRKGIETYKLANGKRKAPESGNSLKIKLKKEKKTIINLEI